MQNKMIYFLVILFTFISNYSYSQKDSLEVLIIDAYVTPEKPHKLMISFYTSEETITRILINKEYSFDISDEYLEDHSAEIDISKYRFRKKFVPYVIVSENRDGDVFYSEEFELILPYDEFIETKEGDNPIATILLGFALYLMPSPNYVITEFDEYFSLTKEIPIITFYSSGYNYPSGSLSIEYTHAYDSDVENYLRLGYKHIIPIDVFEYISPGVTGFTNFDGFNGVGAEVSLGLFNIYDVFTVYTRYRYNFKPKNTDLYFHEISIGLYSNFFTIDF